MNPNIPARPAPATRPDLSDYVLSELIAGAAAWIAAYVLLVRPTLPPAWRTPGSPELYLTGIAGALLLLVSMVFVVVKRSGRGAAAPTWFVAHVVCATLGTVLVVVHSAGYLRRPPALLLLALLGLIVLGVWASVRGSRRMAATFATKRHAFAPTHGAVREDLAEVIAHKRDLLPLLEPTAQEATFSPTLGHWIRHPVVAAGYARLVHEESRLIGARASVAFAQAYWRPLHLALAYLFVIGLLAHIVTVTFFAGYVAHGEPITWWHLAEW